MGCATKVVYIPTETVRTIKEVVHDTSILVRLMPSNDSISTLDTLSVIDRKTARTTAKISRGLLMHTLEVKDVPIRVEFKYVTKEMHDTTTRTIVQPISKSDKSKIDGYDKLKASNKSRGSTILKLWGLLALSVILLFRKPIFNILLKIFKPI